MTPEEYATQVSRIKQHFGRLLDFNPNLQELMCKSCGEILPAPQTCPEEDFVRAALTFYRDHYSCGPGHRCACNIRRPPTEKTL